MTAKAPPPAPGGPDRDALERSLHKSYDRPTQAWVCGRVASGEPGCRLGPGPDGTCREKDSPCQPRRGRRQSLRRVSLLATLAALSIFAVAAGTRRSRPASREMSDDRSICRTASAIASACAGVVTVVANRKYLA